MVTREGFVYEQKPLSVTRNVVVWEGWSLVRVVVRQGFYCISPSDALLQIVNTVSVVPLSSQKLTVHHICLFLPSAFWQSLFPKLSWRATSTAIILDVFRLLEGVMRLSVHCSGTFSCTCYPPVSRRNGVKVLRYTTWVVFFPVLVV